MSLSIEPDYQTFIDRFVLICEQSALLFPKTIGGDNTKFDLVNQIITNQLPIPNLPIEGPDPPYIFVTDSETPQISEEIVGRDSIDTQGGKRITLEFYLVILSSSRSREESEKELFAIVSALTTTLSQNKRLGIPSTPPILSPLAVTHTFQVVPYNYDITQNETLAKNIVVRPVVGVNLR